MYYIKNFKFFFIFNLFYISNLISQLVTFDTPLVQIINKTGYKLKFDFKLIEKILENKNIITKDYTRSLFNNDRFIVSEVNKIFSINFETDAQTYIKTYLGSYLPGIYSIKINDYRKENTQKMRETKKISNIIITITSGYTQYNIGVEYKPSLELISPESYKAIQENKPLNAFLGAASLGNNYKANDILGLPEKPTIDSIDTAFYEIKLKWNPTNSYFKTNSERFFVNKVLNIARKAYQDLGGKEQISFSKVKEAYDKDKEPTAWDYLDINENATKEQIQQAYKLQKNKFSQLIKSTDIDVAIQAKEDLKLLENAYKEILELEKLEK